MKSQAAPKPNQTAPGQNHYFILGACSLAVVFLTLLQFEAGLAAAIVLLVGVFALLTGWRAGPVVIILALVIVLRIVRAFRYEDPDASRVSDLILAAATLCYCVSHYRMLAIRRMIFPRDTRLRAGRPRWQIGFFRLSRKPAMIRRARSAHLVTQQEIALLLVSLPGCAVLAQLMWEDLRWNHWHWPASNPGMPDRLWLLCIVVWTAALLYLLATAILGWWCRRHMTTAEATLLLQDTVWRQTRREQRLLNRWLAYARLHPKRKKDAS